MMNENLAINCFCPHCGNQISIQIERTGKVGGIIGGAISGAIMGSNVGIAAGPIGAIAGTIPGLVIGAILGDNIGSKIDNPICSDCNTSFKIPQQSINEYKQRLKNIDDFIQNPLDGEEILKLRYEYYTYFYRFLEMDPKSILTQYTINEFDINYKPSLPTNKGYYDIDYELNIDNCTITTHIKIFQKLLHLFKLNDNYLQGLIDIVSDVHEGFCPNNSALEEYKNFLNDFRNTFYEQIRNSTNPKLQIILSHQKNSNLYEPVLRYYLFTTYYLLNMRKLIEMNMDKYDFEYLKKYITLLTDYYSEHLIEMQTRELDRMSAKR